MSSSGQVAPVDSHTALYAAAGVAAAVAGASPTVALFAVAAWKFAVRVHPELPWDELNSALDVGAFAAGYALAATAKGASTRTA